MSVNVDLQYVVKAEAVHHDGFSVVRISDGKGSAVKLYFDAADHAAKADAVAAAINGVASE